MMSPFLQLPENLNKALRTVLPPHLNRIYYEARIPERSVVFKSSQNGSDLWTRTESYNHVKYPTRLYHTYNTQSETCYVKRHDKLLCKQIYSDKGEVHRAHAGKLRRPSSHPYRKVVIPSAYIDDWKQTNLDLLASSDCWCLLEIASARIHTHKSPHFSPPSLQHWEPVLQLIRYLVNSIPDNKPRCQNGWGVEEFPTSIPATTRTSSVWCP